MTGDNSTALGLSSLQIYYPELMSGPIFIPDQGERNAKETARILDQVETKRIRNESSFV